MYVDIRIAENIHKTPLVPRGRPARLDAIDARRQSSDSERRVA